MRYSLPGLFAAAAILALPAFAQPPEVGGEKGDRPGRDEMRERMLKEFDADGDGKLNDEERQKARASMRERFGRRGPEGRRGPDDRPGAGDGKGRRDGRGPEGRRDFRGPGGPPPRLERLFEKFDENSDDSLSRDEFNKLAEFVRQHRPGPPGPPPHGPRFDGRGPDGPPPPPPGDEGFRRRYPRHDGPPGPPGPGRRGPEDEPRDGENPPPPRPGDPPGPPPNSDADPDDAI